MDNKPLPTRPRSDIDNILLEKFAASIATQSTQLDDLGRQLLTLELAIPGLYATILKLISGDAATLAPTTALYLTFAFWFLALLFTLISLFPRNWRVDPKIMRQDPTINSNTLGIADFFEKTANYKRRLLTFSSLLFFAGVFSAAFTIV